MKVLNLYAGIGGNRKLWNGVDCTAVEIEPKIAKIYGDFFPDDKVIVGDAHQYLLEHYNDYDFIWSSPPCQSHSQLRYRLGVLNEVAKPVYPDMKLYEEIIFLQYHFKGKWCAENTEGYYKPLIKPQFIQRHFFWSNFVIADFDFPIERIRVNCLRGEQYDSLRKTEVNRLKKHHKIELSEDIPNQRILLRNCVYPELGKHIFDCAFKLQQKVLEG